MQRLWALLASLLTISCSGAQVSTENNPQKEHKRDQSQARRLIPVDENELLVTWKSNTHSPNPRPPSQEFPGLEQLCGEPDQRLDEAARWLLARGPLGRDESDIDRLTFALRAAGTPYVRPVAWSRGWPKASPIPLDALEKEFRTWISSVEPSATRRCGMAMTGDGPLQGKAVRADRRLVVVAAQALAELVVALPTEARVGTWLSFEAELLADADHGRVILLAPDGEPQQVPTWQQGRRIRSRFAAGSPGKWLVQLLASTDTGPRPMLESVVYVDADPETYFTEQRIPGERAELLALTPEVALDGLVTGARAETGRATIHRDLSLDTVALEHAFAMRRASKVGHDVGNGNTPERLARAGIRARLAGENVVHAADAIRAHRALWASPSHRTNLLHRGFSRWGLGVTTDNDGSLWVCEVFASSD